MTKFAPRALKQLPLAVAVVAALQMAPVWAQDQATTDQSSQQQTSQNQANNDENAQELEAITVTGSLLKRPEYQTTAPVQTVNIQADLNTGSFSTANMLQATAIASGSTQINNQFSGFIVEGGTGVQSINLRGLGAARSLILLDGQRPGPAGTRGQVGAFDLNVIPQVILSRIEIVKDGSSSIYGSDAVAGVVNLITRKRMDSPEFNFFVGVPQHGGGKQVVASFGTGWNFDRGNITVAAQFQKQYPLKVYQRDYLSCVRDMMWDAQGNRIDRADHSVLQGTDLAGCDNLYANSIIKYTDSSIRYVPSRDGSTVGPFPGYHPRPSPSTQYNDPDNPDGAYYEDQLNFPWFGNAWALNQNQNTSLYGATSFRFGGVNWDTQWLYNHRLTATKGWRQFFPLVSLGPFQGDLDTVYQPIMPFPMNSHVTVDYFYGATKFSGLFMSTDTWSWEVNANHSRSRGDYYGLRIDSRLTGDLGNAMNEADYQPIDYFDPGILNGDRMDELVAAVGLRTHGRTTYDQSTANAIVTGDLFELPAGGVSSAFGIEYRHMKLDDQPDEASKGNYSWGFTSADVTKGTDHATEVFGEVGIPLLKGIPGIQSLSLDLSARTFKYSSVGERDHVWKMGVSWQIIPTLRFRGSLGTSYRAPGLYELYLGDQTGFVGQLGLDPCILWGESTNEFIRANCAAAGIPDDYDASGTSSATIHSGGGAGFLKPETSRAKSAGFVWTPDWGNFNLALDYFDYEIRGQIAELGEGSILFGCYGAEVFPNHFCEMIDRNPPDDPGNPNMITDVYATYININQQRTRGYDLQFNWDKDFSFGHLAADAQITYQVEDSQILFDSAEESGRATAEYLGYIGRPKTTGLANIVFTRGDWTYTWQGFYTAHTRNLSLDGSQDYFGEPAFYDMRAGWQLRHNVSVRYDQPHWGVTIGVRNLFDKEPDLVSSGVSTMNYGNVPLLASQYDLLGRTFFTRLNYKF